MKANIGTPNDHMEKSRIDYVLIIIVLIFWLGVILQTIN